MGKFIKGDVVILPFPFSDLSGAKRRPALLLANLPGDDILLCQITSQYTKDTFAVLLAAVHFTSGSLPIDSFIRPTRIFTADENIILRKAGAVKAHIIDDVVNKIIHILTMK